MIKKVLINIYIFKEMFFYSCVHIAMFVLISTWLPVYFNCHFGSSIGLRPIFGGVCWNSIFLS